jgi:hypothetical protein
MRSRLPNALTLTLEASVGIAGSGIAPDGIRSMSSSPGNREPKSGGDLHIDVDRQPDLGPRVPPSSDRVGSLSGVGFSLTRPRAEGDEVLPRPGLQPGRPDGSLFRSCCPLVEDSPGRVQLGIACGADNAECFRLRIGFCGLRPTVETLRQALASGKNDQHPESSRVGGPP